MRIAKGVLFVAVVAAAVFSFTGCSGKPKDEGSGGVRVIVASDTILSGMIASLLPPHRYSVDSILPPGQCPGHYDVKLSDIERIQKAALTVSFRGMPFMSKAEGRGGAQIFIDEGERNWMAPDSYAYGLAILANELAKRFPEDKAEIARRKADATDKVKATAGLLVQKVRQAGIYGKPVVASSMQKEPLLWMGFRVAGEYGRQEAMSTREVVRLLEIGRDAHVILVVDNLQSGPDAGKGIAETLRVPHVVLTNFPSEKGYIATLEENVNTVLAAARR